jgi:hypothetical protein
MSVQFKQLLEASYHQVNVRVEELKRFLDLTKTYSIKTSSHIKIITSLVNELTDSDDTLTLIDTEVAALNLNQRYTHTTNINRTANRSGHDLPPSTPTAHTVTVNVADRRSNFGDEAARSVNLDRPPTTSTEMTRFQPNIDIKNNIARSPEEAPLYHILESVKNENQKLWESLKKGQSDTDFIKNVFEKLLDSFTKQKPEVSLVVPKEGRDSLHQPCTCTNCLKAQPIPGYPQGVSQSCYVPQNQQKRKPNCLHATGLDHFEESESLRSLKEGLDGFPEGDPRRSKKGSDAGINGMFKQFVELKKELERVTDEKNRQIADLTRLLEETRSRSELLLREVQELAVHKNGLESATRELLTSAKLNADKVGQNFEQRCRALERDVQRMEGQVEALTNENDNLRRLNKDNERWKNEEDFYKVKLSKLENDYNDLQRNLADAKNRNGELVSLLEKSNEARSRTKVTSETSTIDYNDDLLKCMYSQADYIEAGMGGFFNDSIFKN